MSVDPLKQGLGAQKYVYTGSSNLNPPPNTGPGIPGGAQKPGLGATWNRYGGVAGVGKGVGLAGAMAVGANDAVDAMSNGLSDKNVSGMIAGGTAALEAAGKLNPAGAVVGAGAGGYRYGAGLEDQANSGTTSTLGSIGNFFHNAGGSIARGAARLLNPEMAKHYDEVDNDAIAAAFEAGNFKNGVGGNRNALYAAPISPQPGTVRPGTVQPRAATAPDAAGAPGAPGAPGTAVFPQGLDHDTTPTRRTGLTAYGDKLTTMTGDGQTMSKAGKTWQQEEMERMQRVLDEKTLGDKILAQNVVGAYGKKAAGKRLTGIYNRLQREGLDQTKLKTTERMANAKLASDERIAELQRKGLRDVDAVKIAAEQRKLRQENFKSRLDRLATGTDGKIDGEKRALLERRALTSLNRAGLTSADVDEDFFTGFLPASEAADAVAPGMFGKAAAAVGFRDPYVTSYDVYDYAPAKGTVQQGTFGPTYEDRNGNKGLSVRDYAGADWLGGTAGDRQRIEAAIRANGGNIR